MNEPPTAEDLRAWVNDYTMVNRKTLFARHRRLIAQVEALTTERDAARETNQRLNRPRRGRMGT